MITDDHRNLASHFLKEYSDSERAQETLAALFAEIEDAARRGIGGNQPPILPEKLIDVDALPALLAENYGPLQERGKELLAAQVRWMESHIVSPPADWPNGKPWPIQYSIDSDVDLKQTSDFLAQLAAFAGGKNPASGEVDEARQKVKRAPFDACKVIDSWFNGLREDIRIAADKIAGAQSAYLIRKAEAERRERQRIAEIEEANARAALEEARRQNGADEATAAAIRAEEDAERARRAADAAVAIKMTSVGGVTTSLRTVWKWELASITELAKAVAEGKAPPQFLQPNESVIGAAVRGKGGLRECPGLRIYDEATAARHGRSA